MTRLKLIPWLAISAVLFFGPALPKAAMAGQQPFMAEEEGGLIYLPLGDVAVSRADRAAKTAAVLRTSVNPEVTIAQYGDPDVLVARSSGTLAVRFDPPFEPPYTISKMSFLYKLPNGGFYNSLLPGGGSALTAILDGASSWIGATNAIGVGLPALLPTYTTIARLYARPTLTLANRTQAYRNLSLSEYSPKVATAAAITGIQVDLFGVVADTGNANGSVSVNVRSVRTLSDTKSATTNGSPTVTTTTTNGFASVLVGMSVSGTGIPANTKVLTKVSNINLTLDKNATATGSNVTLTFSIPTVTKPAIPLTIGGGVANYTLGGPGDNWGFVGTATDLSNTNLRLDLIGATTGTTSFLVAGYGATVGSTVVTAADGFTTAAPGMRVTGTGIPTLNVGGCSTTAGSNIVTTTTVDGFMSVDVGSLVTATPAGVVQANSVVIEKTSTTQIKLSLPTAATGSGRTLIFPNTTVVSEDSNLQLTLSQNATSTGSPRQLAFSFFVGGCTTVAGGQVITTTTPDGFADVVPGMLALGPGATAGIRVLSKESSTQITLAAGAETPGTGRTLTFTFSVERCATTSASPVVTTLQAFSGAAPGMHVAGAGIAADATIVSVDSNLQITLSRPAASTQIYQTATVASATGIKVDALRLTVFYNEAETLAPASVAGPPDWENPARALPASVAIPKDGLNTAGLVQAGVPTGRLIFSGLFGTNPPVNAPKLITGISVDVLGASLSGDPGGTLEARIRSLRTGGPSGSKTVPLTGSPADYTLGGNTDLWGATPWTQTDFDNPNFRVELAATGAGSGSEFSVDAILVTVYYVTPGYFQDVRVTGMTPGGLPDLGNQILLLRNYRVARPPLVGFDPGEGLAEIPVGLTVNDLGKTFFLLLHFPAPPATNDSFPFIESDRGFTEKGLYANSHVTGFASASLTGRTQDASATPPVPASPDLVRGSFATVLVGDLVTGIGIPFNTVVTEKSPDNKQVRLSQAPTIALAVTGCSTTAGNDTVNTTVANGFSAVADSSGVVGPGIPGGTFVLKRISNTRLRLSQPATATATGLTLTFDTINQTLLFERLTVSSPPLGALAGAALMVDQNLAASMTCELTPGTVPLNAPTNLGANLRAGQTDFRYHNPADVLADGTPAPSHSLGLVELVRRDTTAVPAGTPPAQGVWAVQDTGGVGAERVSRTSLPSGLQVWGVQSVDVNGRRSIISNTVLTGPASVIGASGVAEDADEPNGRAKEEESTALTVPATDRAESIWPAGDQDNFTFTAQPGQLISVAATPTNIDNLNDLRLVARLLDNKGDEVTSAVGAAGAAVSLSHTVAPPSGNSKSTEPRTFILHLEDRSNSSEDPAHYPRVLVAPTYNLSVDVTTSAALNESQDPSASGAQLPEVFAFANAGANPVRGRTTFSYAIPRSVTTEVPVKLRIYDVRGRLVSMPVNGAKPAGRYLVTWSGHDVRGNRVGSGLYFARFQAGPFTHTVRIDMVN